MRRIFLLLLLCLALGASAQERPKLGLVLSGGGAKGALHVGVLKAMEEAGLRPDFIAGTSMGSVVGGLYAIGYSADEIEQILMTMDWDLVLSNQVPLNYISFEEKEYYNRYLVEFPIEGTSLKLPSGLIEGQVLGEFMRYYLWTAKEYENFDEFPIVYRCVGTNVATGEPILFDRGDLATAIRSSMALPTAFTAVEVDSVLVVDGGVVDNFPVEQLIQLGADKIIGVNVGTKLKEPTPESMVGILMSLAMIPSAKRLPQEIEDCDIYIEPDLGPYSTASFGNVPEIIELGKNVGQEYLPEFEAMAEELGMDREPFSMAGRVRPERVDSISVEGNTIFSDALVDNKLGLISGQEYSRDQLQSAVRRVFGINGFDKVDYIFEPYTDTSSVLRVQMREKERARLFASVHFDNIFSAGILLNLTARDLLGRESRTVAAVDISKNPRFRFDYYKYMGKRKAVAANLRYDFLSAQLPQYDKGEAIDINIQNIHSVSLGVLTTQSLKESVFIGADFQSLTSRSRFSVAVPEGLRNQVINFFQVKAAYTRNSLNNRNFPTEGSEFYVEGSLIPESSYQVNLEPGQDSVELSLGDGASIWITGDELNELVDDITPGVYGQLQIRYQGFFPLAKKTQLLPYGSLALTISAESELRSYNNWRVGGYQRVRFNDLPVLGLNYAELETVNFGSAGVKMQHVIANQFYLQYGANLYGWYEFVPISQYGSFDWKDFYNQYLAVGYGVELNWKTRLGPIGVGVSTNTDDGYFRYHISAGFSFNYED
ncbi:patatin-like phospholipase family protein [Cryomorphaceae bacterium]|nr:patatin-like phospholipase family protein [Cryomorphaceae bacterium]